MFGWCFEDQQMNLASQNHCLFQVFVCVCFLFFCYCELLPIDIIRSKSELKFRWTQRKKCHQNAQLNGCLRKSQTEQFSLSTTKISPKQKKMKWFSTHTEYLLSLSLTLLATVCSFYNGQQKKKSYLPHSIPFHSIWLIFIRNADERMHFPTSHISSLRQNSIQVCVLAFYCPLPKNQRRRRRWWWWKKPTIHAYQRINGKKCVLALAEMFA